LCLSDIHIPYEDPKALATALEFAEDVQPDILILNGDILDLASCSGHGDANQALLLEQEIACGNEFLDDVRDRLPHTAIVYTEGNHETRLTRFVDKNAPSLAGSLTVPKQLRLKERGIEWLPYGKVHFVGKLGFSHGVFHGDQYAKQTLQRYGCSLVVGHAHRPQLYTQGTAGSNRPDAVRGVFGNGCLCPVDDVPYIKGPSGWTQGIFLAYVEEKTGHFTPFQILFNEGRFVFGGTVYG